MSTRATVWLRSEKQNITRYLYHHCDGYMLDEELDPILKGLDDNNWFIPDIMKAITDYDDAYREKDEVGWDSEYVYKIDVDNHTLTKYECGIEDTTNGDRCEEKTQEKYRIGTWAYGEDGEHFNERIEVLETTLDDAMRAGYLKGVAALQKSLIGPSLKRSLGLTDEEVQTVFKLMAE